MSKSFRRFKNQSPTLPNKKIVASLLDSMVDGMEYGSLLDVAPADGFNVRDEIRRAIADIETLRGRPLLVYAANTVSHRISDVPTSIVLADDLPFTEMVANVETRHKAVDVLVVTPGGSGQQVAQFVTALRGRFENVAYFVPQVAMSAGTIWVLSGDEVWMDERASIGPIDPQVPGRDGRFLPAQALLGLIEIIRERGEQAITKGLNPAWTDQLLLRHMDAKEIGAAHTASGYAIQLVASYLENFKFRQWTKHKNGDPVTPEQKRSRAIDIARRLSNHDEWKAHSHGISREVAWDVLQLKIDRPETVAGLNRAIRRLWALLYYVFDNGSSAKIFISREYSLFRSAPMREAKNA